MKSCPNHQKTLWLDVYGELPAQERPAWERHLKICDRCRLERQKLVQMLQLVKESIPASELSQEESEALEQTISRTLRRDLERSWWRKLLFGITAHPIPALLAACLLVVVLGWFGLRQFQVPSSVRTASSLDSRQEVMAKDLEIIEELELLEQMDVLEKVVQVIDHSDIKL